LVGSGGAFYPGCEARLRERTGLAQRVRRVEELRDQGQFCDSIPRDGRRGGAGHLAQSFGIGHDPQPPGFIETQLGPELPGGYASKRLAVPMSHVASRLRINCNSLRRFALVSG
jgi:hypothetical protein